MSQYLVIKLAKQTKGFQFKPCLPFTLEACFLEINREDSWSQKVNLNCVLKFHKTEYNKKRIGGSTPARSEPTLICYSLRTQICQVTRMR